MISVVQYGAAGDGDADDAPAFQAALDVGGHVIAPAGTYRLGAMLRIGERTRLTLDPDAVLVRDHDDVMATNTPSGGGAGGYDGPGGITVEGGVWDVNGVNRPVYSGALAIAHATGVTIQDLTVRDVPGWHALEINGCRTVRIRDCRFEGFTHGGDRGFSEAIQLDSATDSGAYPWGGPYDDTACDDVVVSGCWVGASATPGTTAWPRGIGSHNANGGKQTNIRITGNLLDGVLDCGIYAMWWDRAVIAHNQVGGSEGHGIAVRTGCSYVDVANNQIMDSGRNGLWISEDVIHTGIRDNTIIGSGAEAHATYFGIRISDAVQWPMITGNRIRKRAAGNHAKYGIGITSTCSGVYRYGNDARSSGSSGAIQDLSVGPITSPADAV